MVPWGLACSALTGQGTNPSYWSIARDGALSVPVPSLEKVSGRASGVKLVPESKYAEGWSAATTPNRSSRKRGRKSYASYIGYIMVTQMAI